MKNLSITQQLSMTAKGILKADVVIKNINLVNVCTHEIMNNIDIAIKGKKICLVGDASHTIGEETIVYDGTNKYASPGFLDGHVHVESSMLKPCEFAKGIIPNGTVAIFYDPHEICNVLGLEGVDLMSKDLAQTPLKSFLTIPSCVPGMPGFEDCNVVVTPEDIDNWMGREDVIGLGEMMNMPGVIHGDNAVHSIINSTHKHKKIVTGHYSMHETGKDLNSYVASGARCCHESTRWVDALAKMRLGMYAQFREGSAWQDLEELAPILSKPGIDSRYACLVTDDCHPNTIISKGHLNHILKKAFSLGIDPITAIQMLTINTATCFKIEDEYGSIAPYKYADIVIFDNFEDFNIEKVFINGELVAENGKMLKSCEGIKFPESAMQTMKTSLKTLDDFKIESEDACVNVIEIIPVSSITRHLKVEMKSTNGYLQSDIENDILKIAVFGRHNIKDPHALGFVKGFGIKSGALAQSVSHDAHNIIVIGTNDEDMLLAANTVINCGGGVISVSNGEIISLAQLSIAGLMSNETIEKVAHDIESIESSWVKLGCSIESPFMTMSVLSLACIPELRITNKGLVDCLNFKFINLKV
ncbi:MAG: adenine deaminase [Mycoplasma sp.]